MICVTDLFGAFNYFTFKQSGIDARHKAFFNFLTGENLILFALYCLKKNYFMGTKIASILTENLYEI